MSEALPIGNGHVGAMIFGGVARERIQFNEESLWSGGPGSSPRYSGGIRAGAHQSLPRVRRLVDAGRHDEAEDLIRRNLTGRIDRERLNAELHDYADFGAFQPFGDIFIDTENDSAYREYSRMLDLAAGLVLVNYQDAHGRHRRTYFASFPSNVLVIRFENDAPGGRNYRIRLRAAHPAQFSASGSAACISGELADNGLRFESRIHIQTKSALEWKDGETACLRGCSEFLLLLSATTNYSQDAPDYRRESMRLDCLATIRSARTKGFDELLQDHARDYQALFLRVGVELNDSHSASATLPTDERLRLYAGGAPDPGLEVLMFQLGRYLLISSSRQGSLPANLQGVWNAHYRPAWASDYHFNINTQMIYWPAEVTALPECHAPLLEYIRWLSRKGRKAAAEFFGARGWTVNAVNNIYGYTAPGWEIPWGYFPAAGAWLCRHIWEHFEYGGDLEYLREVGLPIMRGAVEFWVDYLVEDAEGHFVSSPSFSPEHGRVSAGATMDQQIVWDLFTNYLRACEECEIESGLAERARALRKRLLPLKVGRWGQLQEWKEDRDDPLNRHRHLSHLFGLYPGCQIAPTVSRELSEAAKISLRARGSDGTGWTFAWKALLWARLGSGADAYWFLRRALSEAPPDSGSRYGAIEKNDVYASGVYKNMLCAHPPFQLDGNAGYAAAVAEMLLQSHLAEIHLLPALPPDWQSGAVTGLRARGGHQVDIEWHRGGLRRARIAPARKVSGTIKVRYGETCIQAPANEIHELHGPSLSCAP